MIRRLRLPGRMIAPDRTGSHRRPATGPESARCPDVPRQHVSRASVAHGAAQGRERVSHAYSPAPGEDACARTMITMRHTLARCLAFLRPGAHLRAYAGTGACACAYGRVCTSRACWQAYACLRGCVARPRAPRVRATRASGPGQASARGKDHAWMIMDASLIVDHEKRWLPKAIVAQANSCSTTTVVLLQGKSFHDQRSWSIKINDLTLAYASTRVHRASKRALRVQARGKPQLRQLHQLHQLSTNFPTSKVDQVKVDQVLRLTRPSRV
jgi:hypothetical protein